MGKTWTEIPWSSDPKVRQFGVAFIDENRGWGDATPAGFQTVAAPCQLGPASSWAWQITETTFLGMREGVGSAVPPFAS